MRRRRKSPLIPVLLAVLCGIIAAVCYAVAGNLDDAYYKALADWQELRRWYGDPKPERPASIRGLKVASLVSGIAGLSLLAVAILRAGRATRRY